MQETAWESCFFLRFPSRAPFDGMQTMTTKHGDASLRPASASDLARVEQLLTASELPLEGVKESLQDFIVAEAGGDIVGVAGLEVCRGDALLRSVAVRPEWRSKGVGRALVNRAIAEAESRGIRALYLLTTTAEHYFPSFGFAKIDRAAVPGPVRATREFTTACPASAVVMSRELSAPS
jgi:amino-acid N-acetyltransferase